METYSVAIIGKGDATGNQGVEIRDAATCLTRHKTAPYNKESSGLQGQ